MKSNFKKCLNKLMKEIIRPELRSEDIRQAKENLQLEIYNSKWNRNSKADQLYLKGNYEESIESSFIKEQIKRLLELEKEPYPCYYSFDGYDKDDLSYNRMKILFAITSAEFKKACTKIEELNYYEDESLDYFDKKHKYEILAEIIEMIDDQARTQNNDKYFLGLIADFINPDFLDAVIKADPNAEEAILNQFEYFATIKEVDAYTMQSKSLLRNASYLERLLADPKHTVIKFDNLVELQKNIVDEDGKIIASNYEEYEKTWFQLRGGYENESYQPRKKLVKSA